LCGIRAHVLDLDTLPQGLVELLDLELGAQAGDGLGDAPVVIADALPGGALNRRPVPILESLARPRGGRPV
jgi:hypothetical protein